MDYTLDGLDCQEKPDYSGENRYVKVTYRNRREQSHGLMGTGELNNQGLKAALKAWRNSAGVT
jgi:hypothetical protein